MGLSQLFLALLFGRQFLSRGIVLLLTGALLECKDSLVTVGRHAHRLARCDQQQSAIFQSPR